MDIPLWKGSEIRIPLDATLPQFARLAAQAVPDAIALIEGTSGASVTWSKLAIRAERAARGLASCGFGRGDCLFMVMPNSIAWYIASLAAQSLGGTVSGINPLATPGEMARQMSRVPVKAVLCAVLFLPAAREAAAKAGIGLLITDDAAAGVLSLPDLDGPALDPDDHRNSPGDPALLPFSSGTTGLPKAVVLTHRSLMAGGAQAAAGLGLAPGDRILGLAPLFHIVGPSLFAAALLRHAAIVVMPRFDLQAMLLVIARHRVTHLPLFPPVIKAFAYHPAVEGADFSSVRAVISSGAPLAPAVQEQAARRIGRPVLQIYGMTETGGCISMDRAEDPTPGSVGYPVAGQEIRILETSSAALLGAGTDGEVQVRGPSLMQGYLDNPDETGKAFAGEGWLRTGDTGHFDAEGRLWLTGRIKELIKVHAGQVPPVEIEMILAEHPAVADVVIVGRPNEHCGEIPVAYVVWRREADPFAVIEWVNDQLIAYKRVRAIESIEVIPRNASGKADRKALAAEDALRCRKSEETRRPRAAVA